MSLKVGNFFILSRSQNCALCLKASGEIYGKFLFINKYKHKTELSFQNLYIIKHDTQIKIT